MASEDPDDRYDEVKRCLARADSAFERAGAIGDDTERVRLIEEAESWLVRAERGLARITGRPVRDPGPRAIPSETRSFGEGRSSATEPTWRRIPRA